jgi:hypothetical protein
MKYILALAIVLSLYTHVNANEMIWDNDRSSISAGLGLLKGETTYQIGGSFESVEGNGRAWFPISELVFPLDIFTAVLDAKFNLSEKWELVAGIQKNITKESGKMKDSDWLTAPNSLDVYSESDAEADALIIDIAAKYYFGRKAYENSRISFFIGGKYIYQNYDFDVYDLTQWYPSQPNEPYDYVSGKVLTYEVTQHIPAVILGTEIFTKHNFRMDAYFGYSPYVTVEDKDNHILRSKISKAECDGDATLISLSGSYKFLPGWTVDIGFEYLSIDTEGRQKQYIDGVYYATIDQKNFSEIASYALTISYLF